MPALIDPVVDTAPVSLWYTRCGVPTGFGVAVQSGLLRNEFADGAASLTALQDSPDPAVHQSHFTHSQPDSFRHGSAFPAIWAQANGADTRVLGLSIMRGAQTLLARPDSSIRTSADLRGKRLLVPRRPFEPIDYLYANTLRLYEIALRQAGLTLDDVEMVEQVIDRPFIVDRRTPGQASPADPAHSGSRRAKPGAWSDTVPPLLRGEVDVITSGGSIGAPPLLLEDLLGLQVVFDADWIDDEVARANNSTVLVFAAKADLVRRRPDLVRRVLTRVLQAEAEGARDPEELARHVAREQFASEHLVRKAHGGSLVPSLRIDFDPIKVAALESLVAYLHRLGLIDRPLDVPSWLDPAPLASARNFLEDRHA